ncbi:MAG: porin, partial [Planctomycetota bacterium]
MRPPWRLPGLLAVAVTFGLGAAAADDRADIEDLRRRIEQLEAGRPRVGSEITQVAWSTAASPPRRAGRFASAIDWSGFLQLDAGAITADDVTTDEVGSINAQIGPRRVRLKAAGSVTDSAEFVIDLDFAASGSPSFRDVAVLFEDVPYISRLEIGRFKQPIGLDAYTSGRELLFMERQLPFAFLPFRQTGVKVGGPLRGGGLFEVAAYVFPTDSFGVSIGDSGGQSLATRLTRLLVDTDDWLVHVGGG